MKQIVLDMGEFGSVIVESDANETETESGSGLVQASLGDKIRQKVTISAQDSLQRTLKGLAQTFVASLPPQKVEEHYQLDTFSVEFQLGFGMEVGVDAGVTTKIVPNGSFKCTYVWKYDNQLQKDEGDENGSSLV